MKEFFLTAAELYSVSRSAFFRFIPDCEVSFVDGHAQMFVNLRKVARDSPKNDRRTIIAMIIKKCPAEQVSRVIEWLVDYFSFDMQSEIFNLQVVDEKIIPEKMLEKALRKIN